MQACSVDSLLDTVAVLQIHDLPVDLVCSHCLTSYVLGLLAKGILLSLDWHVWWAKAIS